MHIFKNFTLYDKKNSFILKVAIPYRSSSRLIDTKTKRQTYPIKGSSINNYTCHPFIVLEYNVTTEDTIHKNISDKI